jgi:membrane-associated phospholipid phosphatase
MKIIEKIRSLVPKYAIIPLIVCLVFNFSVYNGVRLFYEDRFFYDLTSRFDDIIPVVPITILIYLGSYIFWIINYILICKIDKEHCYRFISAELLGKLVCFITYISLPTTNIRPEITQSRIFWDMLQFLYNVDPANNLFPSIHCLVSWYCFAGLRKSKTIPLWYKYVSLIIALMICVSTLTTRQHVIVDVLGGVLLAELTWQFTSRVQLSKIIKINNQEISK